MNILTVMDRIKALQEFEIKTTLPENFRFKGRVPFDIHIVDNEATIKVLALNLEEAMMRVNSFIFEDNGEGDCR